MPFVLNIMQIAPVMVWKLVEGDNMFRMAFSKIQWLQGWVNSLLSTFCCIRCGKAVREKWVQTDVSMQISVEWKLLVFQMYSVVGF
jgi:hypothetical protein